MAIADAINKVTGGHGSIIEEAVKNLSSGGGSGSGGILVVHSSNDRLDHTWQEIYDAMHAEKLVVVHIEMPNDPTLFVGHHILTSVIVNEGKYQCWYGPNSGDYYVCDAQSDYPAGNLG